MNNEFEDDWKVLRRSYADVSISTTMSVAEGLERLTKALRKFLDLESIKDSFSIRIDHKVDGAKIGYKIGFILPTFSKTFHFPATERALRDLNDSPVYHPSVEQALEWLFNNVSSVFRKDRDAYEEEIKKKEDVLINNRDALRSADRYLAQMGKFDLDQPPLPLVSPDGR